MKTQVKSHARKGTRGVRSHSRNVKKVPHNTRSKNKTIAERVKYYDNKSIEFELKANEFDDEISDIEEELSDVEEEIEETFNERWLEELEEKQDKIQARLDETKADQKVFMDKSFVYRRKFKNLAYKPLIQVPKLATDIDNLKWKIESTKQTLKFSKEIDDYTGISKDTELLKKQKTSLDRLKKRKRKLEAVIREVNKAGY